MSGNEVSYKQDVDLKASLYDRVTSEKLMTFDDFNLEEFYQFFHESVSSEPFDESHSFSLLNSFYSFISKNNHQIDIPHFFIQQIIELIQKTQIKGQESILSLLTKMIDIEHFSVAFSSNCGDMDLLPFFQTISPYADDSILNIFCKMHLNKNFPIDSFLSYFSNNRNDYRYLAIIMNCMNNCEDINFLFNLFLQFPPVTRQTFNLFCRTIISFFQHFLDEKIFVDSHFYESLSEIVDPTLSIQDLAFYLQITARLSSYPKILDSLNLHPNFIIYLFLNSKQKSIIVPIITIISAILSHHNNKYNNDNSNFLTILIKGGIIEKLISNISESEFVIRVKSLALLNSILKMSDKSLIGTILMHPTGQLIAELLSSDNEILESILQFIHHILCYAADSSLMNDLIKEWTFYHIEETLLQIGLSDESNNSENALILGKKISNFAQMTS
ncbi:hypothetical protein TRFO_39539 [Tritrichomonas foetus]|uniref:Armadillo repeat-containing domain-containing protein n=1 Tax=Tritrichomonas foetus TaxID=1144522 RepID=A0A1J4J7R4_9EUKA|nr:hypothetical protein TRFO_39539 [Tritrichomonas foetus]|eukprot:OHS94271.1 hypothetical protein TRFO_39539 [Tritrichomonas foetus]